MNPNPENPNPAAPLKPPTLPTSSSPPPQISAVEEKPLLLAERPSIRMWIEALLRQPKGLAGNDATGGRRAFCSFLAIAVVSLGVFGVVLGTFAYHEQLWAAPAKLIAGTFFAALICFPSLYIFASLAGAEISLNRLASLLAGMLALSGMLLLGFAPAIWIFTQGTSSFGFMGFLAIGTWLVATMFSFRFLFTALRVHGANQGAPLTIWAIIFLLVGLQLTTTLRPILGKSDRLFTPEKKFFLEHWGDNMDRSLRPSNPTRHDRGRSDRDN
jgi:hypothetical protein